MRKILLVVIAVLVAVPAFAVQVYNNEENASSVDIYGLVRGYVGYGHGMDSNNSVTSSSDNFFYGFQVNSRLGVRLKIGQFSGNVEIGANEKTLYTQTAVGIGFRQAWGAYSFGNAGTFLVGKTDTPTTMGGFSSDIMNTDSGLQGFGGNGTSNRRFQMAYRVMGLDIALIEDDMVAAVSKNDQPTTDLVVPVAGYTDDSKYIPRLGLAYTYKNPSVLVKVGATYTASNGSYTNSNNEKEWTNIHAFGVVLGVKPTFMENKLWLGIQGRYGMNEHLYGEATTVYNNGSFTHTPSGLKPAVKPDGTIKNVSRANVALELGYKVSDSFSAIIGGGFQTTMQEGTDSINSFGAYLQAPYTISKNFALVPQITYLGFSKKDTSYNAVVLAMQARVAF